MTKNQFLELLEGLLSTLSYDERRDILYDYEEHFRERMAEGKTDEEIASTLGSPRDIARKYLPDLPAPIERKKEAKEISPDKTSAEGGNTGGTRERINYNNPTNDSRQNMNYNKTADTPASNPKGNNPWIMALLALLLIPLNIIFVFPTYIGIVGSLVGLIAISFALVILGLVLLLSFLFATPFAAAAVPLALAEFPILGIFGSLALISLSGLLLIASIYIFKFIIHFTVLYVKWNATAIRGY